MPTPRDSEERAALEASVRAKCAAGDLEEATALAIQGYGRELMGFLAAIHQSESDAHDVFAEVCEDLWRSLAGFRWQSSLRTWAYMLARQASWRFLRAAADKANRQVPLSQAPRLSGLVAQVRTESAPYLRTEVKNRVRRLRESLDLDDQMLLILRLDKDLSWNDVARVTLEREGSDEDLRRESARLRKRYELIKEKLVALGRREGLFAGEE